MSKQIDWSARASALVGRLGRCALSEGGRSCAACTAADAAEVERELKRVALEAGDLVERAHRDREPLCPTCEGEGDACYASDHGDEAHECDAETCEDCGGTGVADAALVLGIERRRL